MAPQLRTMCMGESGIETVPADNVNVNASCELKNYDVVVYNCITFGATANK